MKRCKKCDHIDYMHFDDGCHVKGCKCKVAYEDLMKGKIIA